MATGGFQSSWGFVPVTHDVSKTTGQNPFMPKKSTQSPMYSGTPMLNMAKGLSAGGAGDAGYTVPPMYVNTPGYDNSGAIRALYDSLRSKGTEIYGKTQGTLKDIYSNLRAAYAPLEENTRTRYNTAIESTGAAKSTGDAEAQLRAGAEDAARREMMARMGIASQADTGSGGATVDMARETGNANRAALQQNWEGLMGSMSAAQQGRDASSLRGATDQETMAMEELATRWSDYQNELAQRQAQSMQGARGGGGQQINPLYAQMNSSNPMIAMMARQQFSGETGMPIDQVYAIMNPQAAGTQSPEEQNYLFNAAAEWGGMGKGTFDYFLANQMRQDNLGAPAWFRATQ